MRKAKVINIFNSKGGVGKTTFAVNLASLIATKEKQNTATSYKVLLIDTDFSANSSIYLVGEKYYKNRIYKNPEKTILSYITHYINNFNENFSKDIILNNQTIKQKIIFSKIEDTKYNYNTLSLIPSHHSIQDYKYEKEFYNKSNLLETKEIIRFQKSFESILQDYDFVFIDSPPNFTYVCKLFISITDYIIVPIELDWQSLNGFSNVVNKVNQLRKKFQKEIYIRLMIPNKMSHTKRKNHNLQQEKINLIKKYIPKWREKYKILSQFEISEPFSETVYFANAQAKEKPFFEINQDHDLAKVIKHRLNTLAGQILGW